MDSCHYDLLVNFYRHTFNCFNYLDMWQKMSSKHTFQERRINTDKDNRNIKRYMPTAYF